MTESISEGVLEQFHKEVGEYVEQDELIATIETDKVAISVNSTEAGKVVEFFANPGDTVAVGADLVKIDTSAEKPAESAKPKEETKVEEAAPTTKKETAPAPKKEAAPAAKKETAPTGSSTISNITVDEDFPGEIPRSRTERRVKLSPMRARIAERLKESQNTAASLTTFNEIDMTNLINLRKSYKETVLDKHGIKLGFMGAFVKASAIVLQELPGVNARIDGKEIVYHDYADISVAVATPKGLVTPVIRNTESLSILGIEKAISALGAKARKNAITLEDMAGGTFTVSNGGVFGSLYGTPIINSPQSAILGMHATKERPVVVNGKIEIRPMMYVALTYDHRVIDGREAVTFLVRLKETIENPERMILEI